MRKLITSAIIWIFLTSTFLTSSFASDENVETEKPATAAETSAITQVENAVRVGYEESGVLAIFSGLVILSAVAIASSSTDPPTAHNHGHGHGH